MTIENISLIAIMKNEYRHNILQNRKTFVSNIFLYLSFKVFEDIYNMFIYNMYLQCFQNKMNILFI